MTNVNTLTGRNGEMAIAPTATPSNSTSVARVTQWEVNPTLDTSTEWGDSDSGGYTNIAAGRRGATFTAEGKVDTGAQVWTRFQPGVIARATLWIQNLATWNWDFPRALNTDFSLLVNIDTEDVVGWTSDWKADGIFYYPGQTPDAPPVPSTNTAGDAAGANPS